MNRLQTEIAESASRRGVSPSLAMVVFWIPPIGAVVLAVTRLHKDTYRFLLTDDGPVEWAQFACFAAVCAGAAAVALLRWRGGHRRDAILYAALAAVAFFVAGEEIAWGQRILGLETPEALREVNEQEEITLHNVEGVLPAINIVMMVVGALGAAAPWLARHLPLERFGPDTDKLFVPPRFVVPAFLTVFGYRLIRLTLIRDSGFTVTKYGEWAEFCLAFAAAIMVWCAYRFARSAQPASRKLTTASG